MKAAAIAVLAAAALCLVAPHKRAWGHGEHDWIRQGDFRDASGNPCCSELDCRMHPVSSGDVIELDNGDFRYVPTGEVVPREQTRPSPDGNYWRCFWHENGQEKTRKLCFWRPAPPS